MQAGYAHGKAIVAMKRFLPLLLILALQGCGSSTDGDSATGLDGPSSQRGEQTGSVRQQNAQPSAPDAATDLISEITCSPLERRQGFALLSWTPADPLGDEQQVVVTIFKDGFETGAFEASKLLSPDENSFLFENVHGQALHRWRVLTLRGSDAVVSETARFEGPICLGDVVEEAPPPIP